MVHDVDVPVAVQVLAVGVLVTVDDRMADPSLDGSVHDTLALALAPVAFTALGWAGTVDGTTGAEAGDEGPWPTEVVARTRNR